MSHSSAEPHRPLDDLSDQDLLKRAEQGDSTAFELIVRRHNQALFRAARGILDDEGYAQEALQNAYLNAFTHMASFQGRACLKTWLTQIVINQAISIKRRQRPLLSLDEKLAVIHPIHPIHPEETQMALHVVDPRTPEAAVSQEQTKRLLETAIRRLPETYRSVFMLRAVEGMSVADSVVCLQLTEAVIKKRLSRARAMLRKYLTQPLEHQVSEAFEFAGKRCDAVTEHVMAELARRGMIKPN